MSVELEDLESYTPPDNVDELTLSLRPYMGNRRDQHGRIPWREEIDPGTGLFSIEISHLRELSAATQYMDATQKAVVLKAAALAIIAHQDHYRDSTHPYIDHLLSPTIEKIKKYQFDEITVAAAILHDTKEDRPKFWPIVEKSMSADIIDTIIGLSKFTGQKTREKIADEKARMQIMEALLDNPRVAIIKTVIDRPHNIKTVHHIKNPRRKRAIIDETQQMYVPLAGILGLKDEEKEMDYYCLLQSGEASARFAEAVPAEIDKFFAQHKESGIVLTDVGELNDYIKSGALELYLSPPTAHDIYRQLGQIKTVLAPSDYYLNADVVLISFPNEVLPGDWGSMALGVLNILAFNGYKVDAGFNLRAFQDDLSAGLTDSLPVDLVRESDGLRIHLTIYPQFTYTREKTSIADMYYQRPPKTPKEEEKLVLEEGDEVAVRHLKGTIKAKSLRERYEREKETPGASFGLVRRLEPRLPINEMRVVGRDDQGIESFAPPIKKRSTVLDYAKSIFPDDWTRISAAEVKKDGQMVSVTFDTILSSRDTVHIALSKKGKVRWDPYWIHFFRTDMEGKERTRVVIRAIVEREKLEGRADMRNRVIEVGSRIIESYFNPLSRPLRIDVGYVRSVIEECCVDIEADDFEYLVGLGEIEEERVRSVAQALEPINRRVGIFRVNFAKDQVGQTEAVTEVLRRMEISTLGSTSGRVSGKGPSFVEVYIDPQTLAINGSSAIIQRILRDARCIDLTMRTLGFTTSGKTDIHFVRGRRR